MVRGENRRLPRLVIAGLAGDTGKTLVSLGVVRTLRSRGIRVAPFKKGPDFIDPQWLARAAGRPARNLDTFLMPTDSILRSLWAASRDTDLGVVEGNRGLFDGVDAKGSHSTAHLSKVIGAPVVLVVDATKVTRTVAAQVIGCRALDPELDLAGVILNRVGTRRQESLIREAVSAETGIPVLGAVPRLSVEHLPSRHLGLVTSGEHPAAAQALEEIGEVVGQHVEIDSLLAIARKAPDLPPFTDSVREMRGRGGLVRVGVLRDPAFSFYYPENLESLEAEGAEIVSISPSENDEVPDVDALYAGGGFPEVHAERLAGNRAFREALARRIAQGLPVWAECGGLMYLSRALVEGGRAYPMVGALPVVVERTGRPQGHGYVTARVDRVNPFFAEGTELRGHEFHYSRLLEGGEGLETVLEMERGVGLGGGRDGIRSRGVVATYTHLHALGSPEWATGMVAAAKGERLGPARTHP